MKKVTIIATSLNEGSKSQVLARLIQKKLKSAQIEVKLFDLRKLTLPFAGASTSWESEDAALLKAEVESSSHVIFAVPIYCYDVNAAAKNVIELIGQAFSQKVIAFACSAGGASSYMSVMSFANHLMLDFRSIIVPRFLYVEPSGWKEEKIVEEIEKRMDILIQDMKEIQVVCN